MHLHSLRYKLVLITVMSSLLTAILLVVLTPYLVEQRFIKEASKVHMGEFEHDIALYASKVKNWGSKGAALEFYKKEVLPRQKRLEKSQKELKAVKDELYVPTRTSVIDLYWPLKGSNFRGLRNTRFLLADYNGHVILPYYDYTAGQLLTSQEITEAEPLYDADGFLIAYALKVGESILTPRELSYIRVLREVLLIAALIVVAVSLIWGFGLSRPVYRRVRSLLQASLHVSEERQPGPLNIKGKDEVAQIAREFDAMSVRLGHQLSELRQSHKTIHAQAKELERVSHVDEVTQLYNRKFFEKKLMLFAGEGGPKQLSLVLCSLNLLKSVNEQYSYQIGDQILKVLAKLAKESCRQRDVVARIDGEALALLLPNTDKGHALEMAETLKLKVARYPWEQMADGLVVTINLGVSHSDEVDQPQALLQLAQQRIEQPEITPGNEC